MTAWIAVLIAGGALLFSLISFVVERRQRKTELGLLRRQVEASEWQLDSAARALEAHVTAEQRQSSGGERTDSYTFEVANAGPAVARHFAVELRDTNTGEVVATGDGYMLILTVGQSGEVTVELPRQHRGRELAIDVLWVDPSYDAVWAERRIRRRRETRKVLTHVSPLP